MITTAAYLLALGYEGAHNNGEQQAEGALIALIIFMAFDLYMVSMIVG